jgi:hypothetical protein
MSVMSMIERTITTFLVLAVVSACGPSSQPGATTAVTPAAAPPATSAPQFKADVPTSITTPDVVETRIGTLKFKDGLPDAETARKVYDNIDFGRGVEAFMSGIPATSVQALKNGFIEAGFPPNEAIGITEKLSDARTVYLTPNATVVYQWFCMDVEKEPMVVEVPPAVLGIIDDAYFRFVTDMGQFGPDQAKGGKFLLVRDDYTGPLPKTGYYVAKTRTNNNLIIIRAFVQNGDLAGTVSNVKAKTRMYPLSLAANPPAQKFVNISGAKFNTVHANSFKFYEELNEVVQHERGDFVDPDTAGLFAAIGIKKGQPFAPDARMKAILTDAVAVGNATSRAIVFASRDPRQKFFADRQWLTGFLGGYTFSDNGERMLDGRTLFHYYATGATPAMAPPATNPGVGSAYAYTARDSRGEYLDGAKTYKVTLPGPVPAARFWSFTVYDNQTRSMLETDQISAGLDSTFPAVKKNADDSTTIYFGPKAPAGQEGNWIQTMPGKGWNVILRLYGPTAHWYDKTWKPGDIELVN